MKCKSCGKLKKNCWCCTNKIECKETCTTCFLNKTKKFPMLAMQSISTESLIYALDIRRRNGEFGKNISISLFKKL